jgi:mono/diheme cytochrome c family protein
VQITFFGLSFIIYQRSITVMYTGLFHTHKLVVILFVVHYVIKLALLLLNRKEQLAAYTRRTRIVEMVISTLFLVTGIAMIVQLPAERMDWLLIVKVVLVLGSIPLAVIGFRRSSKGLALLSVFLLFMAYGLAEMHKAGVGAKKTEVPEAMAANQLEMGNYLYHNAQPAACVSCHGEDGKAGIAGSKDLTASQLSDDEMLAVIKNGKNAMPKYKKYSEEEIRAMIAYIRSLKK